MESRTLLHPGAPGKDRRASEAALRRRNAIIHAEANVSQPIISNVVSTAGTPAERFSATGVSFAIHEWRGSGPALLHVHHADDEAWHVLEGALRFRFGDRVVDAGAGTTVFVPAGVPHTFEAINARYLITLTPRLAELIAELQRTPDHSRHGEVYRRHESELLETDPGTGALHHRS